MSVCEEREAGENNQWRKGGLQPSLTIGWGSGGGNAFPSGGASLLATIAFKEEL